MINLELFINSLPLLFQGALTSLIIAFSAMCIGLIGGTILAIAQKSNFKLIKYLANIYQPILLHSVILCRFHWVQS